MIALAVGQRRRLARCRPPGTQQLPGRVRSVEVMLNVQTRHEPNLICAYPIPLIHTILPAPCAPICARITNGRYACKPYFTRLTRLRHSGLARRVPRFRSEE